MTEPSIGTDHARAERALADIAERFAIAARSCIRESLARSVERFVGEHAEELAALDDETVRAFRTAVDAAIDASAEVIAARLRDPGLWTSPRVRVREDPAVEETSLVGWFLGEIGLRRRPPEEAPEERLDDPNNRVWIALLNAADPLDPVFAEFGFTPSREGASDPGGGHFGLQPRTQAELDPRGRLTPIWRDYVGAFADHRRAVSRSSDDAVARRRASALSRWRRKA